MLNYISPLPIQVRRNSYHQETFSITEMSPPPQGKLQQQMLTLTRQLPLKSKICRLILHFLKLSLVSPMKKKTKILILVEFEFLKFIKFYVMVVLYLY